MVHRISARSISHWKDSGQRMAVGFRSPGSNGQETPGTSDRKPATTISRSSTPLSRTASAWLTVSGSPTTAPRSGGSGPGAGSRTTGPAAVISTTIPRPSAARNVRTERGAPLPSGAGSAWIRRITGPSSASGMSAGSMKLGSSAGRSPGVVRLEVTTISPGTA